MPSACYYPSLRTFWKINHKSTRRWKTKYYHRVRTNILWTFLLLKFMASLDSMWLPVVNPAKRIIQSFNLSLAKKRSWNLSSEKIKIYNQWITGVVILLKKIKNKNRGNERGFKLQSWVDFVHQNSTFCSFKWVINTVI